MTSRVDRLLLNSTHATCVWTAFGIVSPRMCQNSLLDRKFRVSTSDPFQKMIFRDRLCSATLTHFKTHRWSHQVGKGESVAPAMLFHGTNQTNWHSIASRGFYASVSPPHPPRDFCVTLIEGSRRFRAVTFALFMNVCVTPCFLQCAVSRAYSHCNTIS